MIVGMIVAAIVQSSGATVMIVGFVNAGLMTLSQAVGVIMGTNIGTALLTQVMVLDIDAITPLFILAGVVLMMVYKTSSKQMIGQILAGFGILFLGMSLMSDAMNPLRSMPEFHALMTKFSNPVLGVLVGTIFTGVIQSSAASVAILQTLAGQGLISLSGAVYLVLGFNIGTTSSAAISCIGSPRPGCRAAIMHTSIKTVGAILFVLMLQVLPLVEWLEAITPNSVSWQISNAHLAFNLINTVLLFPFANLFVKLAYKILPEQASEKKNELQLQYINDNILTRPSFAVESVRHEVIRMGKLAYDNVDKAARMVKEQKAEMIQEINAQEETINFLNTGITGFLVKLSQSELAEHEALKAVDMIHIVSDIERMGDHAIDILELGNGLARLEQNLSDLGLEEFDEITADVLEVMQLCLDAMNTNEPATPEAVRSKSVEIGEKAERYRANHIDRMRMQICDPEIGTMFTDIMINYEQICDHADNIARLLLINSLC